MRSRLLPLSCAAALLALGPRAARAQGPAGAAALADEGLALALRDDAESLGRALELFESALRADPKLYPARAHHSLVELLVAAAQRDEAVRLEDGTALLRSGRELRERALDELRPLVREHAQDPSVVRALAVYYGLDGDLPQLSSVLARARPRGSDPWIDFAEMAAGVRSGTRAEAIPRLEAFVASHPALLRARLMLARAEIDASRREQGLAALDDLLAANPRHAVALREKARVLSPPPPRVAAVPPPNDAPPPQMPGYLPRKQAGPRAPATRRAPSMP